MFTEARKRIYLISIFLVILFSYQNCAPVRFSQGTKTISDTNSILDNSSSEPSNTDPNNTGSDGSSSGSSSSSTSSSGSGSGGGGSTANPLTPTNTSSPGTAILTTKMEASSLYFEKPASQDFNLTSILKFDSNLNIYFHSGYSYPTNYLGMTDAINFSCLKDATCTIQQYFDFWNTVSNDDILQFLVTTNSYNSQDSYSLDCSNINEAFLCSAFIQANNIKKNQPTGLCTRKSVAISTTMRVELEIRYDRSYSGIYTNLILDQDCLCYYEGKYTVSTFPNQLYHIKHPALDSHCKTNFSEYQ
jgi:hypothetical protein